MASRMSSGVSALCPSLLAGRHFIVVQRFALATISTGVEWYDLTLLSPLSLKTFDFLLLWRLPSL